MTNIIILPNDGSSIPVVVGTNGYSIIENQSTYRIQWTTSGASTKAWHSLKSSEILKIDFDVHVRSLNGNTSSKICVTK